MKGSFIHPSNHDVAIPTQGDQCLESCTPRVILSFYGLKFMLHQYITKSHAGEGIRFDTIVISATKSDIKIRSMWLRSFIKHFDGMFNFP